MSKLLFERHSHDLPDPGWFARGSLAECDCGAMFTGGNPGNPAYSSWRRIGWFGKGWRRLVGRLP